MTLTPDEGYLVMNPNNSSSPTGEQPSILTLLDKGKSVYITILNNPTTVPSVPGVLKIGLNADGPNAIINQVEDASLSLFTNNTERFTILGNGFIGIQNTTPTELLDISGRNIAIRNNFANNRVLTSDANGVGTWQELTLSLTSNHLTINGFSDVDLSSYLDNTDNQNLSLSANILSISNGNNVDLSQYLDNTDEQNLSINGHDLTIDNGNTITLPDNVDDADANSTNELITGATLNGNNLEITDAGGTTSVDLSVLDNSNMNIDDADADPQNEIQDLNLWGTVLSITNNTNATNIDLSVLQDGYEANTDNQVLDLNGTVLSIENGNNVDLSLLSSNIWQQNQDNDAYYNNGNIGIGIETPQSNLHIHNNTPLSGVGTGTGFGKSGETLPPITNGGTSTIQLTNEHTGNTVNDGFFIQNTAKNGIFNLKEIGNIDFRINNQNAISIYSSRDVKINKLAGGGNRVVVANSNGVLQASTNIDDLIVWTKVGNKIFYNGGKVGIGTNEPEQKLDINGRLQVRGSDIILGTDDGREQGDYLKNRAFVHAGDDKLIINYYDWGNQSPDFEGGVEFGSDVNIKKNALYLSNDKNHGLQYVAEFDNNSVDGPALFGWGGGVLGTKSQGTDENIALQWDRFGKVGIGTAPVSGYKLTVKGKIISQENVVVADVNSFPDYVFADNYKPISLDELERFITKNNHLPEIPTTADVKKEGIKLGEMNIKLLKKVEELTLYTIEQENKLTKQQKLIDKLIKRIEKIENNK